MSQHDMSIANQGFPAFRSDLNDALQALVSQNSGATAPSTTFANMLWYDTANNLIKMRNEDNDAWVTLFEINQTTDVADIVRLAASQTLTNKTLTTPVINGFTGDTSVVNIGSGQIYKDTSGNTGFGTTSPTDAIHAKKSSGSTYIKTERATQSGGEVGVSLVGGSGGVDWSMYQPAGSNTFNIWGNGADRLSISSNGNTVVNETGADSDFRVESDTNSHALVIDAGANNVLIGTSSTQDGFGSNTPLKVGTGWAFYAQGYGSGNNLILTFTGSISYMIEIVYTTMGNYSGETISQRKWMAGRRDDTGFAHFVNTADIIGVYADISYTTSDSGSTRTYTLTLSNGSTGSNCSHMIEVKAWGNIGSITFP